MNFDINTYQSQGIRTLRGRRELSIRLFYAAISQKLCNLSCEGSHKISHGILSRHLGQLKQINNDQKSQSARIEKTRSPAWIYGFD